MELLLVFFEGTYYIPFLRRIHFKNIIIVGKKKYVIINKIKFRIVFYKNNYNFHFKFDYKYK